MSTVSRVMDMIDQLDVPEDDVKDILRDLRDAVEKRLLREDEVELETNPTGLFKKVYRVEVLSDEDVEFLSLDQIHYEITVGHSSGEVTLVASGELTREEMREELLRQGSDPSFLLGDEDEEDDDNEIVDERIEDGHVVKITYKDGSVYYPTVYIDDAVICPRHGGVWGDDETCSDCTDEDGDPRPVPNA